MRYFTPFQYRTVTSHSQLRQELFTSCCTSINPSGTTTITRIEISHSLHPISHSFIFYEISEHSLLIDENNNNNTNKVPFKLLANVCSLAIQNVEDPEGHSKCFQGNHAEASTVFPSHNVRLSYHSVHLGEKFVKSLTEMY